MTQHQQHNQPNWTDQGDLILVHPPTPFDFDQLIGFLRRTTHDPLNQVDQQTLTRGIELNHQPTVIQIQPNSTGDLQIRSLNRQLSPTEQEELAHYVWKWFDLSTDLTPFYTMAEQDPILTSLIHRYHGLRIIGIPDLFEAITWAITGQLINIQFAYTLKTHFVHNFGRSVTVDDQTYWLYPTPERIGKLTVPDLRQLKFTNRKAEYIIGVAQLMTAGTLSQAHLLTLDSLPLMEKALLKIRGIGHWTAHYVMMKCLHQTAAFPIQDVGLHNAIKNQLDLDAKPTLPQIRQLAANWQGWEAYATFYLWRSLYDVG